MDPVRIVGQVFNHENSLEPSVDPLEDIKLEIKEENDDNLSINEKENAYKCKVCPEAFSSFEEIAKHSLSHQEPSSSEKTPVYKCTICPQIFVNPEDVKSHAKMHANSMKPQIQFKVFKRNFTQENQPEIRLAEQTKKNESSALDSNNSKAFRCSICKVCFRDRNTIEQHTKSCRLRCFFCLEFFKNKDILTAHKDPCRRKQEQIIQENCSADERKKLTNKSKLPRIVVHGYEVDGKASRRYQCSICMVSYLEWRDINVHVRVCRLYCSKCQKAVISKEELDDHMEQVHGLKRLDKKAANIGKNPAGQNYVHLAMDEKTQKVSMTLTKQNLGRDRCLKCNLPFVNHVPPSNGLCRFCTALALRPVQKESPTKELSENSLKRRKVSHPKYNCFRCNIDFDTLKDLNYHILNNHEEFAIDNIDNKKNNQSKKPKLHEVIDIDDTPENIPKSPKINNNPKGLTIQKVAEPKPKKPKVEESIEYFCLFCEMSFKSVADLKDHMKNTEHSFDCLICHREFRKKSHLVNHLKNVKHNLDDEVEKCLTKVKTEKLPNKCAYCGNTAHFYRTLQVHMKKHCHKVNLLRDNPIHIIKY